MIVALIIFFILLQMVESYVLTPNITGARSIFQISN